jgi:hypothetical protein
LFGSIIIYEAEYILAEWAKIVIDFLSIVTARADKTGLIDYYLLNRLFKVAEDFAYFIWLHGVCHSRKNLALCRGKLIECRVLLIMDESFTSVSEDGEQILYLVFSNKIGVFIMQNRYVLRVI